MGTATGKPRGRPPGAKNKRTERLAEEMKAAANAIRNAIEGAFEGDAHALMMTIYKNPQHNIEVRLDAAKAAIRFEKPALAAIEHSGDMTVRHEDALDELDDEPRADNPPAAEE